jgi:protein TonB
MSKQRSSTDTAANADAAWTLVRWIGIPLVLVAALYFVQRALDEKPMVVVTNHGPMLTPEEMAAAHPVQPQSPATTANIVPAPLVPIAPPMTEPAQQIQADAVPQPISQPGPTYPQRALDAEKEGVVRLRLFITPDGRVAATKILRAEPSGWFERAAEDGVKRWRYTPSEFGGTAEVDVEFKLK